MTNDLENKPSEVAETAIQKALAAVKLGDNAKANELIKKMSDDLREGYRMSNGTA